MKRLVSVLLAAYLLAGCVAASRAPGDDSPAAGNQDRTPMLCRNGTPPPCNDRD
jgi:PBP1b-binding outer membrane lipoprotein LpoB